MEESSNVKKETEIQKIPKKLDEIILLLKTQIRSQENDSKRFELDARLSFLINDEFNSDSYYDKDVLRTIRKNLPQLTFPIIELFDVLDKKYFWNINLFLVTLINSQLYKKVETHMETQEKKKREIDERVEEEMGKKIEDNKFNFSCFG